MTELVIFLVAGFFWLAGFCAGLAGRPRPRLGPPKGSYGPRLDPSLVHRGNGHGGPTTPKPPIKPQPPGGRRIRIDQEPPPPSVP